MVLLTALSWQPEKWQKTEKVGIVKNSTFFAGKFFYMFLSIQIRNLNFR